MDAGNTAPQGCEQATLDRFFVPASEIGDTDKTVLRNQLDWAAKEYSSEFRNFPRGKSLTEHIFSTIKKHDGITTKELIRVLGLPKTTVYDHVKYLVENERSVRKVKGQLHIIGSPPKILVKCGYHNITVLFLTQHETSVLERLCNFLNESDLFKGYERKAVVWPSQRTWRPITKTRSIKIACTKDPLHYEEMVELRSLIWQFFGQKKRLRFNLERNIDLKNDEVERIYVPRTTITRESKFIRQYPKRINNRKVIRTETSAEGEFDEILQELEEQLEKEELWEKIRLKDRVIKELNKKDYRMLLDMEKLKEENQKLKEELRKLKNN